MIRIYLLHAQCFKKNLGPNFASILFEVQQWYFTVYMGWTFHIQNLSCIAYSMEFHI